jgi:hypothetical protein
MSNIRFTGLLALCAVLAACSDSPTSRSIAPPRTAPSFDVLTNADPFGLRTVDLSALGEIGTEQAATGGRASGHADIPTFAGTFRDHYSFVALSTAALFGAKGEFEGGYDLVAGGLTVRIHGDVDCLVIMGNQAWVSGPIEEYIVNGVPLPTTNRQFLIRVIDNGEGANDPPDQASFIAEPFVPQTCRNRAPLILSQNERGNIQVQQK